MSHGTPRSGNRGLTLVETSVGIVVLSFILVGAFGFTKESSSTVSRATATLVADDNCRQALLALLDTVQEGAWASMDTSQRTVGLGGEPDESSDRFTFSCLPLSQCLSPTCRFHTRENGGTVLDHLLCGADYRSLPEPETAVRGKLWPGHGDRCPADGYSLSQDVRMDCLKLFTARDASGLFTRATGADATPKWAGLVILVPYTARPGEVDLRRYDVQVSDLLAGEVDSSLVWTLFNPGDPSMMDLFDFGTDGTTDGNPDGSVPVTAETTDADEESFRIEDAGGEPAVVFRKRLHHPLTGVDREALLTVRLRDGFTHFAVSHRTGLARYWRAEAEFTRAPRTIVSNLTEFAVSTKRSNPYDAEANPLGVQDPRSVRITVGASRQVDESGTLTWVHSVNTLSIRSRN